MGGMIYSYEVSNDPIIAEKQHKEAHEYVEKTMAQSNIDINFSFKPVGTAYTLQEIYDKRSIKGPEMKERMASEIEKMVENYKIIYPDHVRVFTKKEDKYFYRNATKQEEKDIRDNLKLEEKLRDMSIVERKINYLWETMKNYFKDSAEIGKNIL